MKPGAVCPACKGGYLVLTATSGDALMVPGVFTATRWTFVCPACRVKVAVHGTPSTDPEREINEYGRTGRASCSVTVRDLGNLYPAGGGSGATWSAGAMTTAPFSGAPSPIAPPAPVAIPERGPDLRALTGSVVGYRGWRIRDWQLAGTGVDTLWRPGVNEAGCASYCYGVPHHAPDPDCHCGLYGLARFDKGTEWWSGAAVLGAIEAWADEDADNQDRFFVHSIGFRAQYAKVILLATSDEYPRAQNAAIRALATEHGADVCKREHLEAAAKEHGQLVPDDLLAWASEGDAKADSVYNYLSSGWLTVQAYQQAYQSRLHSLLGFSALSPAPSPPPPKKARKKGISQTLGYPGPPSHGKYRRNDRVRDRDGAVWHCVKGGQPGVWEDEAATP